MATTAEKITPAQPSTLPPSAPVFDLDALGDAWDSKGTRTTGATINLADLDGQIILITGVTETKRGAKRLTIRFPGSDRSGDTLAKAPEKWIGTVAKAFASGKMPPGASIRVRVARNKERGIKLESAK